MFESALRIQFTDRGTVMDTEPHSLWDAVRDRVITPESALRGLTLDDILALSHYQRHAQVVLRLRSAQGTARCVLSVCELVDWHHLQIPLRVAEQWWSFDDLESVTAMQ